MAAPKGNENSKASNRLWADTIRKAAIQSDGKRLRAIAERLLEKAAEGDIAAIRELGDRLDGKSIQAIEGSLDHSVTVEIVRYGTNPVTE